MEANNLNFYVKINLTPEIFNKKEYYFWIILNNATTSPSNYGFGWATSLDKAFEEAKTYYTKLII